MEKRMKEQKVGPLWNYVSHSFLLNILNYVIVEKMEMP
jgi:hypothetical protein